MYSKYPGCFQITSLIIKQLYKITQTAIVFRQRHNQMNISKHALKVCYASKQKPESFLSLQVKFWLLLF